MERSSVSRAFRMADTAFEITQFFTYSPGLLNEKPCYASLFFFGGINQATRQPIKVIVPVKSIPYQKPMSIPKNIIILL